MHLLLLVLGIAGGSAILLRGGGALFRLAQGGAEAWFAGAVAGTRARRGRQRA